MNDYVIPHEAYIQACAEALESAGIPIDDWQVEEDSLSVGWIDLERKATATAYGDDQVVLVWSEERGWSVGWGTTYSEHGLEQLVDLNIGVLPTPAELLVAAKTVVATPPAPDPGPYGRYRSVDDQDDLDAQLATYRQPAQIPAPTQKGKRREEIHYRVALLLTNGARIRPVCRVPSCDWRGQAHVTKPAAEHERAVHQAWHAAKAAKAAPSRPVTPS